MLAWFARLLVCLLACLLVCLLACLLAFLTGLFAYDVACLSPYVILDCPFLPFLFIISLTSKARLPVKWMPPESLFFGESSTMSDM